MMATSADGNESPFVKGNKKLARFVHENKRFPATFQGLSDRTTLREGGIKKHAGGIGVCKTEDVIDLDSDEDDRERTKPVCGSEYWTEYAIPVKAQGWLEESSQGSTKRMMDDKFGEVMEAENRMASRKRLFVTKNHHNIVESRQRCKNQKLRPAENIHKNSLLMRLEKDTAENGFRPVRLSDNRGFQAASSRGIQKNERNGDSAGGISLANADVIDWMSVTQKEKLTDRAWGKLPSERTTQRTVAVSSHSSATAKKSVFPTLQRVEAEKSFKADLDSRECQIKPRMRGVLKITGVIRPQSASPVFISKESPAFISKEPPVFISKETPAFISKETPAFISTESPVFISKESPGFISKKTVRCAVSEKATEKAGSSQKHEEIRSLLKADRHLQKQEESEERKLLRQTLETFEVLRRKVLQEEEVRVRESRNGVKRPDLKAGSIMKSNNQWLNRAKTLGALPGVEVGDQFYFRIELCIIGLHRQIQGGIDSIHPKDNQWDVPLAASIIASGGYEDDLDDGETLIYTGQGGNNYQGDKRQQQDQKLERGNLALKHSYKIGVAVRVIRGSKCKDSPSGKVYTYDGLYKVEKFWLDKGLSGYGVYKFQLQRLSGQSQTSSAIVKFMGTVKSKPGATETIIIDKDISRGKEGLKVFVVNSVDMSPELPAAFEYATNILLPHEFRKKPALDGCRCIDGCLDPAMCCCIKKNGGQLPYTGDGALIKVKNILYECGPQCQCPPTCLNRVSQHGTKHRLEVFKKERGWGLRSWDFIPLGGFICEYIGQVVASAKAQNCLEQCNYVLHLDQLKQRGVEAVDGYRDLAELAQSLVAEGLQSPNFLIDAREYGNVSRFINHSDSPNLYVQFVLYDHGNLKLPHVMLFAMENLRPFTELTFDCGKDVVKVSDAVEI